MSVDDFISGLSAEATEAVRRLLRQAYDRGFREALASAGPPEPAASDLQRAAPQPAVPEPPPASPASAPPVAWTGGHTESADGSSSSGAEDNGAEPDDDESSTDAPVVRPILPHATIGTLRRRIIRTFDLERFDIDVVICRTGDADRRQLKSSVKLGFYRREER
jgi:hypothetical protein